MDYNTNYNWQEINLTTEQIADYLETKNYSGYLYYSEDGEDEYGDNIFDSKEKFYASINESVDHLLGVFDNNNYAKIYRAISATSTKDIDMDDIGESWSIYKDSAIAFGSHNGSNILIEASVGIDNVNWLVSILRYFNFSGANDGDDENELVVIDSSAGKLKDVKASYLNYRKKRPAQKPQSQIQESVKINVLNFSLAPPKINRF